MPTDPRTRAVCNLLIAGVGTLATVVMLVAAWSIGHREAIPERVSPPGPGVAPCYWVHERSHAGDVVTAPHAVESLPAIPKQGRGAEATPVERAVSEPLHEAVNRLMASADQAVAGWDGYADSKSAPVAAPPTVAAPPIAPSEGAPAKESLEEAQDHFVENRHEPSDSPVFDLPALPPEAKAPTRELADAVRNFTPAPAGMNERLKPDVRAAFRLGRAGAVFAARREFVSVLRRVAQTKDAAVGVTRHGEALAEGLRLLDQADDFTPRGDALETDLDVEAIVGSHGKGPLIDRAEGVAPHEAAALYASRAAERLAEAVSGERVGSMALYGLGKTYARLEAQSDDPTAGRKSTAMFRAAHTARPDNHLAANELGVRLAREGRHEPARNALRVAAQAPDASSTVLKNLAEVERRLGDVEHARFTEERGERLAERERSTGALSRQRGIEWVSPESFANPTAPRRATEVATRPTPETHSEKGAEGAWTRWVKRAEQPRGDAPTRQARQFPSTPRRPFFR